MLRDAGYKVSPNHHIALSWVEHRQRMYLDVYLPMSDEKVVYVVEIDENMHGKKVRWKYDPQDEADRPKWVKDWVGEGGKVYFIRFNPNIAYSIDGKEQVEVDRQLVGDALVEARFVKRVEELIEHLEWVTSDAYIQEPDVVVKYMYYDIVKDEDGKIKCCNSSRSGSYRLVVMLQIEKDLRERKMR